MEGAEQRTSKCFLNIRVREFRRRAPKIGDGVRDGDERLGRRYDAIISRI